MATANPEMAEAVTAKLAAAEVFVSTGGGLQEVRSKVSATSWWTLRVTKTRRRRVRHQAILNMIHNGFMHVETLLGLYNPVHDRSS